MSANSLFSKRSLEGYLLIDNSATLGMGGKQEFATLTCSHCQKQMIKNPDRTRERAYCPKCDHYLCDACGVIAHQTKECVPYKKIVDDAQEAAERQLQSSLIIV